MSHLVRSVLDEIFGSASFRNEIVWKRTTAHSDARTLGAVHELILVYSKGDDWKWNQQYVPNGVISAVLALGNYYNAVSHTDLVYRVLRHFEHRDQAVPPYPLIVVDECQDFSLLETSFIDLLAAKSPVLIAGDDDQALYAFKNASARFLRELAASSDYERFPLPYCSRCTKVIVDAVNDALRAAVADGYLEDRLDKPFECFVPDKLADSAAHPTIIHAHCTVERNNAPYVGRYISEQIGEIPADDTVEAVAGGYPTALVIGPNPFLERAYDVIKERFPRARLKTATKVAIDPLDGYRLLARDEYSRLGWRIIIACYSFDDSDEVLAGVLAVRGELSEALPPGYQEHHLEIARILRALIDEDKLDERELERLCEGVGRSVEKIREALALADQAGEQDESDDEQGREEHGSSDEPSIICTSLVGAKGLSAGYVYIVGLNNGHLPRDPRAITDEEICSFLVGLSRTRKECHLISCGRLGNEQLRLSVFLPWVAAHTSEVRVDANYFKRRSSAPAHDQARS